MNPEASEFWVPRITRHIDQFVYCVTSPTRRTARIGVSRNPRRHIQRLQSATADPLVLIAVFNGGDRFKRNFQKAFRDKWLGRDWFDDADGVLSRTFAALASECHCVLEAS